MNLLPTLIKQGYNRYLLPKEGAMRVDALVFLNKSLYAMLENGGQELQQLRDAATLPGVFSPVLGMPDIHAGFGLPIGGVLAMRAEDGVVSSGVVGTLNEIGLINIVARLKPLAVIKGEGMTNGD